MFLGHRWFVPAAVLVFQTWTFLAYFYSEDNFCFAKP